MTITTLKTLAGAASALILLGTQAGAAGTDRVRAEAYFNAISGGNAETIASFYADNAEFHWVGGPLAGVYTGKPQIKGVWERFSKAAGDINYKVVELSESQKGTRSTVTARVNFIGPKEVPVRFIMIYENGKIVNEIWEVDKPVVGYISADTKADAKVQGTTSAPPEVGERDVPARDEHTATAGASHEEPAAHSAPVQENTAAAEDVNTKAPAAAGTPTPLPPDDATPVPPAPQKKAVTKPAPKKRYAEKKKEPQEYSQKQPREYSQRDDDRDDGYDSYADSDYGYYGRTHRYYYGGYGRFGRRWYGGAYDGYGGYGGY